MLKDKPCTKRGILSKITSIFGTLGFVAPILLEGNKILRELCKENTCWDEQVSDAIKAKSGLDISARPLTQASVKSVGRVQITDHSPVWRVRFFIAKKLIKLQNKR